MLKQYVLKYLFKSPKRYFLILTYVKIIHVKIIYVEINTSVTLTFNPNQLASGFFVYEILFLKKFIKLIIIF